EYGDAEARFFAISKTEVARAGLFIFLLNALRSNRLHQRDGVLGLEDLGLQLAQTTMQAQRRRSSHRKVNVRSFSADNSFEKAINLNGCHDGCFVFCVLCLV